MVVVVAIVVRCGVREGVSFVVVVALDGPRYFRYAIRFPMTFFSFGKHRPMICSPT